MIISLLNYNVFRLTAHPNGTLHEHYADPEKLIDGKRERERTKK